MIKKLSTISRISRAKSFYYLCLVQTSGVDCRCECQYVRGELRPSMLSKAYLQALLPQDARTIYNFHKGLLRHGQRICVFERPRCNRCPITDLCDYYKKVVKPQ